MNLPLGTLEEGVDGFEHDLLLVGEERFDLLWPPKDLHARLLLRSLPTIDTEQLIR